MIDKLQSIPEIQLS